MELENSSEDSPLPNNTLFFIARYELIDAVTIFLINFFSWGFIKDVPEKYFINKTFKPLKEIMPARYIEICHADTINDYIDSEQ